MISMNSTLTLEIAQEAARLIVDEGMEYAAAKRKAARQLAGASSRQPDLPGNEILEDAVREHISLFCADTQPQELAALRELALQWMKRLASHRPYLGGAVWRGTATRHSSVLLDLYCDDAKMAEIDLINQGVDYEAGALDVAGRREPLPVLSVELPCRPLGQTVLLQLNLHDHDELRGALKPDAQGRSWRGDAAALQALMEAGHD